MSEMALDLIRRAKEEGWKRLDLGYTGIVGEVPAEIWELDELEELILSETWEEWADGDYSGKFSQNNGSGNQISFFPSPSLPLHLAAGQRQPPQAVLPTCLARLRVLVLADTEVADIQALAQLTQLQSLDLSETQVVDIQALAQLNQLQSLDLRNTEVADIQALAQLTRLQYINLDNTQVADIQALAQLTRLQYINLDNTQVVDIQALQFQIEKGLELSIADCPLINPPYEIAIDNNEAILSYWRDRDLENAIPATELKLFLVGNTTAGKSSLAYVLTEKEFPEEIHSTFGARIDQVWKLGDKTIYLWDFGGQEYFHATHHLLVNDNALYIVLVDPATNHDGFLNTAVWHWGDPESRIEKLEHFHHRYWLEMVSANAPRAKVMLFWNKIMEKGRCDQVRIEDAEHALFKDDNTLRGFPNNLLLAIQEKDPFWIRKWEDFYHDLSEAVEEHLNKREVLTFWPHIWDRIAFLARTRLRISREEFDQICLEKNPHRDLGNIITYLRDMVGRILYWERPDLNRYVYIHPHNIHFLIYAILSRQVIDQNGRFSFAHAQAQVKMALAEIDPMDKFAIDSIKDFTCDLIKIMKEFKLVFEVKKDAQEYVAPQYLPFQCPETVESVLDFAKLKHSVYIRFKHYIPRHIVPHFIAAKGLLAVERNYWKHGIVFEQANATVFLWVNYPTRTISIYCSAITKQEQGHPLKTTLHEVLALLGTKPAIEISTDQNHWVDYDQLQRARRTQARMVESVDQKNIALADFEMLFPETEPSPKDIIDEISKGNHGVST